MRSIMTGMLLSLISLTVSTWFLSSSLLKSISTAKATTQAYGPKSSFADTNSTKLDYASKTTQDKAVRNTYYYNTPWRSKGGKKGIVDFGPRLSLRAPGGSPFGPKLNLRSNRSSSWKNSSNRGRQRQQARRQSQQYQQNQNPMGNIDTKNVNLPSILSGYKAYVDLLNNQMKDE